MKECQEQGYITKFTINVVKRTKHEYFIPHDDVLKKSSVITNFLLSLTRHPAPQEEQFTNERSNFLTGFVIGYFKISFKSFIKRYWDDVPAGDDKS